MSSGGSIDSTAFPEMVATKKGPPAGAPPMAFDSKQTGADAKLPVVKQKIKEYEVLVIEPLPHIREFRIGELDSSSIFQRQVAVAD